jgi:carboxylesterase type B
MIRETEVKCGRVRGLPGNDPRITVYKGIPYAAPPVNDLRWAAPKPADKWDGTLDAYRFAPISIQDQPGVGDDIYCREWHVDPDIPMSEDCLYLNIWTPARTADEKLPVMIWYFGGAFQWGYTAELEFNGERLARRGMIVVSINYRLGVFGFLSHPELTAQSPDAPSNFGLLDQQAGLRWVYDNISAFGGDPDNITIAGQSAGGGSVLQQLCNKENASMLKGAAMLSGIIRFPDGGDDILRPIPLKRAEKLGVDFLDHLGVSSIDEARGLDPLFIRDRYAGYAEDHLRFAPIIDGIHYIDDPYELFVSGKRPDIPIITGYTADEFIVNGLNCVKWATENAVNGALSNGFSQKHYVYEFSASMPGWDDPGTFHSCDLWFWFETLGMCWRPFGGDHFMLARKMSDYLANFVKYHDPNGAENDDNDPNNSRQGDGSSVLISKKYPVWDAASVENLNIMKLSE